MYHYNKHRPNQLVDEIFSEATEQLPDNNEVERKRSELISWIKQGSKLSETIKQLEKSSPNVIEKVYDECNEKESAAPCDLIISKFALLLGGLDAF
jgi:ribosomal protein S16